jgi:hypothetical protein
MTQQTPQKQKYKNKKAQKANKQTSKQLDSRNSRFASDNKMVRIMAAAATAL